MSVLIRPGSYSAGQLAELAAILEKKSPGLVVPLDELERQLLELMFAVGRADDGSEEALYFREAGAHESSHAELAEQFQQIAAAADPLDPGHCRGVALTALNAAARTRWTSRLARAQKRPLSLRNIPPGQLSDDVKAEIRDMALRLAAYHGSFIRRGPPSKDDQDTLLEGIAEIFLRFTNLDFHSHELPHATNSLFIRFAHIALRPFFPQTEASRIALFNRWKRLKRAHRRSST